MTTLPEFRPGQSLIDWSANEFGNLVDIVREMAAWMEITKRIHLPELAKFKTLVEATAEQQLVVVRSILAEADLYVNVQRVEPKIVDGTWEGSFQPVGDVVEMAVYPLQTAVDYEAFLWPVDRDPMTAETCVLPAMRVEGVWYVMQYLRHRLAPPDVTVPIVDCAVSVLEPSGGA